MLSILDTLQKKQFYKKDGKFGKNSFMPETKLIQN